MTFLIPAFLLAVALAMDAFAIALAQGAAFRLTTRELIKISLLFGVFQGVMPLIGWLLGEFALSYIDAVDHWIAFALLGFLGLRLIFWSDDDEAAKALAGWPLIVAAIAESVDAFAAGLTLPTLGLPVLATCLVIAGVTAVISAAGVKLGAMAGERFGRPAEIAGGIILISLGTGILLEQLAVL